MATLGLGASHRACARPDDLIVPSRLGRNRSVNHMLKKFHQDLERIGLRPRRQHDARRTFISLALADGGRKDVLRWITHGPEGGDIIDLYTTLPWHTLCEEVARLKIDLRPAEAEVIALAKYANSREPHLHSTYTAENSKSIPIVNLRGGRDLKLKRQLTENPSGTRPWPVSPRRCRGISRRFVTGRDGAIDVTLHGDGTTAAREASLAALDLTRTDGWRNQGARIDHAGLDRRHPAPARQSLHRAGDRVEGTIVRQHSSAGGVRRVDGVGTARIARNHQGKPAVIGRRTRDFIPGAVLVRVGLCG